MSKAVKLKNNLYLDTRGIVHNKKILNTILFPIGYVYLSVNNTNPGTIFGGKWEQISGYYLYLGTGGTKTNYTGIGTQNHTLTVNQIPSHRHIGLSWLGDDVNQSITLNGGSSGKGYNLQYYGGYVPGQETNIQTRATGGGQGHSHNIATYQVYAWKRVS